MHTDGERLFIGDDMLPGVAVNGTTEHPRQPFLRSAIIAGYAGIKI